MILAVQFSKLNYFKPLWTRLCKLDAVDLCIIVFLLSVALAVFYFDSPPILDYPNHYARIWLIAGGIEQAPFKDIYHLDWSQAHTNIGIDLLAASLGKVIGADFLSKLLLFAAITFPPLGAIALQRQIFPGIHPWQIFILFLAWNTTLIGGFINYNIGIGLALFYSSIDYSNFHRKPYKSFLFRIFVGATLCLTHIFSLMFAIVIFTSLIFGRNAFPLKSKGNFLSFLGRLLTALVPILLPAIALLASAKSLPGMHRSHNTIIWNSSLNEVLTTLITPFTTYVGKAELLFIIPSIMLVVWGVWNRRIDFHLGLVIGVAGLLMISAFSPLHMMGTGWIAWRFPIMAALLASVCILPYPNMQPGRMLILALLFSVLLVIRSSLVLSYWYAGQSDSADLYQVLKHIPAGSKVLPVQQDLEWARRFKRPSHRYYAAGEDTFRNLPALAIPRSHAFVPTLFTAKGKQPVVLDSQWGKLAAPEAPPASTGVLSCKALLNGSLGERQPYLYNWRRLYDYILVINASEPDRFVEYNMPQGLNLVVETKFVKLYKIIERTEQRDSAYCRS